MLTGNEKSFCMATDSSGRGDGCPVLIPHTVDLPECLDRRRLERCISYALDELCRAARMHGPFKSAAEGFYHFEEEVLELKEELRLCKSDFPSMLQVNMNIEAIQAAAMSIRYLHDVILHDSEV